MKRGDVVVVDWPYSDRTGSKLRPAVVVQADFLNGPIDDTVLVSISASTGTHGSSAAGPAGSPGRPNGRHCPALGGKARQRLANNPRSRTSRFIAAACRYSRK